MEHDSQLSADLSDFSRSGERSSTADALLHRVLRVRRTVYTAVAPARPPLAAWRGRPGRYKAVAHGSMASAAALQRSGEYSALLASNDSPRGAGSSAAALLPATGKLGAEADTCTPPPPRNRRG